MKTSKWWFVFFFLLGGIGVVAAQNLLFVKATGQQPSATTAAPPVRVQQYDGILTEESADGRRIQVTRDGTILSTNSTRVVQPRSADGMVLQYPMTTNPETAKLMQEEMAAAQEAQKLTAEYRTAQSDGDKEKFKTALRDKLTAVFDLQQKRRASEIEQIQTRLKKLQETMSKRDAAKTDIVERRLQVLTGGIDELGWEDTFRGPHATTSQTAPVRVYGPPSLTPAPAGAPADAFAPTIPGPEAALPTPANVPAAPALPGVVPVPTAPTAPDALPVPASAR